MAVAATVATASTPTEDADSKWVDGQPGEFTIGTDDGSAVTEGDVYFDVDAEHTNADKTTTELTFGTDYTFAEFNADDTIIPVGYVTSVGTDSANGNLPEFAVSLAPGESYVPIHVVSLDGTTGTVTLTLVADDFGGPDPSNDTAYVTIGGSETPTVRLVVDANGNGSPDGNDQLVDAVNPSGLQIDDGTMSSWTPMVLERDGGPFARERRNGTQRHPAYSSSSYASNLDFWDWEQVGGTSGTWQWVQLTSDKSFPVPTSGVFNHTIYVSIKSGSDLANGTVSQVAMTLTCSGTTPSFGLQPASEISASAPVTVRVRLKATTHLQPQQQYAHN